MRWALDSEQEMFVDAFGDVLDRAAIRRPGAALARRRRSEPSSSSCSPGRLARGRSARETPAARVAACSSSPSREQLARRAAPSSAWTATVLALPALDDRAIRSRPSRTAVRSRSSRARPIRSMSRQALGCQRGRRRAHRQRSPGTRRRPGLSSSSFPWARGHYLVESSAPGVSVRPARPARSQSLGRRRRVRRGARRPGSRATRPHSLRTRPCGRRSRRRGFARRGHSPARARRRIQQAANPVRRADRIVPGR